MLASLFDFPFEERNKLTYWSDLAAGSPSMGGGDVSEEERYTGLLDCLETFTRLWHERKGRETGFLDLLPCCSATPTPPTWWIARWSFWETSSC